MASTLWPNVCPAARVGTTLRSVRQLRTEIGSWLRDRRADSRFARFAGHFTALEQVTGRMLDAIEHDITAVRSDQPSGVVYERCRAADSRLGTVRRLHGWYADKYDQRLDAVSGVVLRGADEVVRSCWSEAFAAVDRNAPTGPLVYLDPRFDAVATPRVSVPTDLRTAADAVVGEFIRELPIPIVALPALCRTEPWWIVLAAHETGHHVQHDVAPGLVATTQEALAKAVGSDGADCWAAWAQEVFADAFAVLTVGPAATWAVEELQHGEPARLVSMPSPGHRYPPPVIRTALLGELARAAECDRPGPGAAEWRDGWTRRRTVWRHRSARPSPHSSPSYRRWHALSSTCTSTGWRCGRSAGGKPARSPRAARSDGGRRRCGPPRRWSPGAAIRPRPGTALRGGRALPDGGLLRCERTGRTRCSHCARICRPSSRPVDRPEPSLRRHPPTSPPSPGDSPNAC